MLKRNTFYLYLLLVLGYDYLIFLLQPVIINTLQKHCKN